MATYKNGLHGPFSGKVGPTIGSKWRDIDYFKSRSSKPAKAPTAKQLALRARFKTVNTFLNMVNAAVQMAFIHNPGRMTGRNAAQSHILTKAWKATPDGGDIDYPNVLISFGDLAPVKDTAIEVMPDGIRITWNKKEANSEQMIICLIDEQEELWFNNIAEVNRHAGEYTLNLGNYKGPFNFHVYIGTVSNDRKRASNSLYLGCIQYPRG
ncbi:MAG: DUF6266 family protein [Arcticibacter sp.]